VADKRTALQIWITSWGPKLANAIHQMRGPATPGGRRSRLLLQPWYGPGGVAWGRVWSLQEGEHGAWSRGTGSGEVEDTTPGGQPAKVLVKGRLISRNSSFSPSLPRLASPSLRMCAPALEEGQWGPVGTAYARATRRQAGTPEGARRALQGGGMAGLQHGGHHMAQHAQIPKCCQAARRPKK
jgi:hypothetical protein